MNDEEYDKFLRERFGCSCKGLFHQQNCPQRPLRSFSQPEGGMLTKEMILLTMYELEFHEI